MITRRRSPKITGAFDLLRDHSKRTLDDLRQHTNGVCLWVTAGALGEWHSQTRIIVLEETYMRDQRTSARDIASTLVHESTHARLDAKGFACSPELRVRIERVCFRRQRAFARRLAKPGDLLVQAEWGLNLPAQHFSREAGRQRAFVKLVELGMPQWLAQAIKWAASRGAD